jgi:hypothetical protein
MDNVRLNDLMFKALDHGILSVSDGEDLIPFVLTEQGIQRFADRTLEESVKRAEEYMLTLQNEPVAAMAYDGFVTLKGVKYEAVCIKAYAKDQEKGVFIIQRYQPKKLSSKFKTVGNPATIDYISNVLK